MGGFFSTLGRGDHSCLVREEAFVDNFRYLGEEFCFFDKDLFDSSVMDIVNSKAYFGTVELELDILGVLYSLTAHWHN